jgi:general secretion pathway protein J
MTHTMSIGRRVPEAGFTLLELMIALALLGMLTVLLFGGLHFGTRVWEKATTATTYGNRIRAAQETIADAIHTIYPFFQLASPTDRHVLFDGEPGMMTFFAPSRSQSGGLDVVTITLDPGGLLAVNSRPELAVQPAADVTHRVLLRGVRSFTASYFGAMTIGAPQQWYDVWHNERTLPSLIRIRVTLADASSQWSDLVVAPRITADESCVYDQLTKYCAGRR